MNRPPVVAGLVFVTLGVLLLADQTGAITDVGDLVGDWWPLAVVAAGLGQALLPPRNLAGGATVALLGAALLLWTQDVVDSLAFVWPVLLIAFGVWLIVGRVRTGSGIDRTDEAHVSVVTVFGDRDVAGPRGTFVGGDVTTVFGDVDLDLRHAQPEGEATMQITTVFGDLDLVVPSTWRVRLTGPQLFGDVRIADAIDAPEGAPVLVLRAVTVFGDVEVRRAEAHVPS
ncbi:hypothetical protein FTX61_16155 [Nitriliruptoraceae bacterium ZYF776]|nr:hypothetical protein [Profundirhabdus halotolerans]